MLLRIKYFFFFLYIGSANTKIDIPNPIHWILPPKYIIAKKICTNPP